jgi:hypothetical protein
MKRASPPLGASRKTWLLSRIDPFENIRMAARSIALLALGFDHVSIPVRLFSAIVGRASVACRRLTKGGARVKQRSLSDLDEKDWYVIFEPE